MTAVWKTKFGTRRVRHDPPTLEEAIIAASGLTDDLEGQIEIAASLMGLPAEKVRGEVMKTRAQRKSIDTVAVSSRGRPAPSSSNGALRGACSAQAVELRGRPARFAKSLPVSRWTSLVPRCVTAARGAQSG